MVDNNINAIISILFGKDQSKDTLLATKKIGKSFEKLDNKKFRKNPMLSGKKGQNEIGIALAASRAEFQKQDSILASLNKTGTKTGKTIGDIFTKAGNKSIKAKKSILDFSKAMGSLSILFAGQALTRNMTRLMTSTVSAFNEISKAQSQVGQGLTALSANFMFLKFTIGNAIATALGPLLPVLIPIIENIVNWVSENQKLAGLTIIITTITAAVITLGAQVFLLLAGINALTGGAVATGLANMANSFTKAGAAAKATAASSATGSAGGAAAGSTWGTGFKAGALKILGAGIIIKGVWDLIHAESQIDIVGGIAEIAFGAAILGGITVGLATAGGLLAGWAFIEISRGIANALGDQFGAGQTTDIPDVKQEDILPWILQDTQKGQGTIELVKEFNAKTGEMVSNLKESWVPQFGEYNGALDHNLIGMDNIILGIPDFITAQKKKQEALKQTTEAANATANALNRVAKAEGNNFSSNNSETTAERMIP